MPFFGAYPEKYMGSNGNPSKFGGTNMELRSQINLRGRSPHQLPPVRATGCLPSNLKISL